MTARRKAQGRRRTLQERPPSAATGSQSGTPSLLGTGPQQNGRTEAMSTWKEQKPSPSGPSSNTLRTYRKIKPQALSSLQTISRGPGLGFICWRMSPPCGHCRQDHHLHIPNLPRAPQSSAAPNLTLTIKHQVLVWAFALTIWKVTLLPRAPACHLTR